jgi:hypothetical protein
MQERAQLTGQTVGVALSGGNVDSAMFAKALQIGIGGSHH